MARSQTFRPEHEPLRDNEALNIDPGKITGPFAFLNPTRAHFTHTLPKKQDEAESSTPSSDEGAAKDASKIEYKWTSRNNRKGRHALVVPPTAPVMVQGRSSSEKAVLHGIMRMLTQYPVWDISWLVAVIFTLGSVIWVINAFFVFLPLTNPKTEFNGEVLYGGGITAFIGATIFEIGSVLLMLEAINENRTGDFGWALEESYDGLRGERGSHMLLTPSKAACTHHHANPKNLVGKPASADKVDGPTEGHSWQWYPSLHDLQTMYIHDLGFLACSWQMFGATIFWISGFTALPGIYNYLSPAALKGAFWAPQIIGGFGFVASGTLFMLETQKKWWLPAINVLGWHIGAWNLIGGVGFFLCPIFGLKTAAYWQFQSSCATFWGSWAFLVGSVIQWYESLDKHPVENKKEA